MAQRPNTPPSALRSPAKAAPAPSPASRLAAAWNKLTMRRPVTSVAASSLADAPPAASAATAGSVDARGGGAAASGRGTHLVVLVHGLVGTEANWAVVRSALAKHAPRDWTVLASSSNRLARTLDGVDACGERLAAEVRDAVAAAGGPAAVDRVSFVGHSMGGLIARHAVGLLYDPATARIAGVTPAHFVSLATPHLGCSHELASPSAVPLISWIKPPPALAAAAVDRAAKSMGRTGAHFFLTDGDPPLLLRLARDDVGGPPFRSALASFATRTAYANSNGDHLVSWAGSSLRHPRDLPSLAGLPPGRGVVRDDGRAAAFGGPSAAGDGPTIDTPTGAAADAAQEAVPHAAAMLESLAGLGWRRVDACFKGTRLPFTAHNLIQATRLWLNWEGVDHVGHVVRELVEVDGELVRRWEAEGK